MAVSGMKGAPSKEEEENIMVRIAATTFASSHTTFFRSDQLHAPYHKLLQGRGIILTSQYKI